MDEPKAVYVVAASKCKVYEYLLKIPARNQTGKSISESAHRYESFKLSEGGIRLVRSLSNFQILGLIPFYLC